MKSAKPCGFGGRPALAATVHAGLGAIPTLAHPRGSPQAIHGRLHLLPIPLPYHESDHVLNIAYNALCQGTCLQDIDLRRNDEAFLDALDARRLPDPTTAGVMASYASVGDIIIAEPRCMIGFAGPRVIRETTHQELPPGFQTAEFCVDHGLVDMIVHRKKMKETLAGLLAYLAPAAA